MPRGEVNKKITAYTMKTKGKHVKILTKKEKKKKLI